MVDSQRSVLNTPHLNTDSKPISPKGHDSNNESSLGSLDKWLNQLSIWNQTQADYPKDQPVHHLFEAQAARTPHAIAASFGQQHLTYSELDQRANQLAHYLQQFIANPDTFVGLYVERSLNMLVSLMGILKAGAAYLPLDPGFPKDRLGFMLADTQAPVLITQQSLLSELPPHQATVICLDAAWPHILKQPNQAPDAAMNTLDLAYIIYTSGSTGKPKGVQISHRALTNFLYTMQDKPGLTDKDILLSITTLSFDISVLELFLPLIVGAQIVIASLDVTGDGALLMAEIKRTGVTVVQATPATWRLLLESGWDNDTGLKILCGGEALSSDLAEILARNGELWNMYGPTETTIWSTIHHIDATDKKIFIGRPIANTEVYLLNAQLQPVPIGEPGELYIGGDGLARGYLNRPGLTADRFVPHPFADQPGERLYKTGDLAQYHTDGIIECLGRIDHQLKIRGYRIEAGEIETALRQISGISQAIVIVREDIPGDKRLVAYLIVAEDAKSKLISSKIRQQLAQTLPNYMIPSAFVFMEHFPLTPNRKVDRKELPAPDMLRVTTTEQLLTLPQTPIEEKMAQIWVEVLNVERIGVDSDFFEFGGHSLLAAQAIARMQQAFTVSLTMRDLFDHPTITEMATYIEAAPKVEDSAQTPILAPVSRGTDLPLSYAQERLWFLEQMGPTASAYRFGLRLTGPLNIDILKRCLKEIIARHEVLRTVFKSVNGQPKQITIPTLTWEIPEVDLRHLTKDEQQREVKQLAEHLTQQPFNLETGPLFQTRLLHLGNDTHALIMTVHQIVFDGWSTAVLMRELTSLYDAYIAKQASPLPKLAIQYADYAAWQRAYLQGQLLESYTQYWKQQLSSPLPVLQLPADKQRAAIPSQQGHTLEFTLSRALSDAVKALSQQTGSTRFMLLLAVYKTWLYGYSQQTDIIVGSPVANRMHVALEGLIGRFMQPLVLRTNFSDKMHFRAVLEAVRQVCLDAYTHQALPFEMIMQAIQPLNRSPGQASLYQAMFTLDDNLTVPEQQLAGLEIQPLWSDEEQLTMRGYELYLRLMETDQGFAGSLLYNIDLFKPETATQMVADFELLLHKITENPDLELTAVVDLIQERQQQQQVKREKALEGSSIKKLKAIKRKSVRSKL